MINPPTPAPIPTDLAVLPCEEDDEDLSSSGVGEAEGEDEGNVVGEDVGEDEGLAVGKDVGEVKQRFSFLSLSDKPLFLVM